MFQAQNRETVWNSTWKVAVFFKIIMMTSVTRPYVFHNTTPDLQDQDQDRFFGLKPVLSSDHSTALELHIAILVLEWVCVGRCFWRPCRYWSYSSETCSSPRRRWRSTSGCGASCSASGTSSGARYSNHTGIILAELAMHLSSTRCHKQFRSATLRVYFQIYA